MRGGRGPRCRGGPSPSGWTVRARVERFTEPAILLLLRDGPRHGYELLERLPEISSADGRIDLGNLYRLLRALEAEGLVSSEWQTQSGQPRRVYQLTSAGAGLLDGWAGSLSAMESSINRFLSLYQSGR